MQTEHTPLLSIIVPIYNVEKYLPGMFEFHFCPDLHGTIS